MKSYKKFLIPTGTIAAIAAMHFALICGIVMLPDFEMSTRYDTILAVLYFPLVDLFDALRSGNGVVIAILNSLLWGSGLYYLWYRLKKH